MIQMPAYPPRLIPSPEMCADHQVPRDTGRIRLVALCHPTPVNMTSFLLYHSVCLFHSLPLLLLLHKDTSLTLNEDWALWRLFCIHLHLHLHCGLLDWDESQHKILFFSKFLLFWRLLACSMKGNELTCLLLYRGSILREISADFFSPCQRVLISVMWQMPCSSKTWATIWWINETVLR